MPVCRPLRPRPKSKGKKGEGGIICPSMDISGNGSTSIIPSPSLRSKTTSFFSSKEKETKYPTSYHQLHLWQDIKIAKVIAAPPNQFLLGKVFHLQRCVGTTKNWLSIGSSVEIFYPTKGSQIHTFNQTIYCWCGLVENNSLKSGIDIEKKWGKSSCEYSQVIPFELNWKQYCLVFKIPVNFHFLCKKSCVCTA